MMILVFILGLIIGSFLAAYTYRAPLGISINNGRSFCPRCKKQIRWYDNLPIISYLLLKGKCRNCHKKISPRYPIIELSTAIISSFVYLNLSLISSNITWLTPLPRLVILSYLILVAILILSVIITDFEHQIILDEAIFTGLIATFVLLTLYPTQNYWHHQFAGFFASILLLSLHLITKGKGMGLGDVKLAVLIGMIFGIKGSLVWLFFSFIAGAIVGIMLILSNKKHLKSRIAFGPFLAVAFYLYLFYGQLLTRLFFPTF